MADYKTKYTSISIDDDMADPEEGYYGYMAVGFNYKPDDASAFFMDSYHREIMDDIKAFLEINATDDGWKHYKDNVRLEDVAILMELYTPEDAKFAPDLVRIVRGYERKFLDKIKEI